MVAKGRPNPPGTHKVEVGEIDTSAPFQSVKDAVSLFGEVAFSGERAAIKKIKPQSAERVLAKETQLHLAQKELNKLTDQLKNAETTRVQALVELERAKRTVEELTLKLKTVCESKESAIKLTEAANSQLKLNEEANIGSPAAAVSNGAREEDMETARKQYTIAITELNDAKQELRKIRQECDASLEARVAALEHAAEAEQSAKSNMTKAGELSKEILTIQESIGQVKIASLQAEQEHSKIFAEKNVQMESYKATLEASTIRLLALKKEYDPELTRNLEAQLTETVSEIGSLQKHMEKVKISDLDSVKTVTSELDEAKDSLLKVAEEESSLRSLVEALKVELENVKKEHSELMKNEAKTESIAGNLHVKLRKSRSELEACITEESKVRGLSDDMIMTMNQLTLETEKARQESEEMLKKAGELKKEAESTRAVLEEAEKNLTVALEEAEEAKTAEAKALDQIKILSERTSAARSSTSESGANITISKEEFESRSRKVEESNTLAEMKVSAAMAQVEAVKASENEALNKLEVTQKEIEEMKVATEGALKKAGMAEAARKAVEGELRRWREREQKKASEAGARILADTAKSPPASPHHYRIQMQNSPERILEVGKLEKLKTSVGKKVLMPSLTGIFHRKKNQVEGGSPSYLPGEHPM